MSEDELITFLKERLQIRIGIEEEFNPYGRGPYSATVVVSLKGETDEIVLCKDSTSFIISGE